MGLVYDGCMVSNKAIAMSIYRSLNAEQDSKPFIGKVVPWAYERASLRFGHGIRKIANPGVRALD